MNVKIFIFLIFATFGFFFTIYSLSISSRLKGEMAKEENAEISKIKKFKSYQSAFFGIFGFSIFLNGIFNSISLNGTSELTYFIIAWDIIILMILLYYLVMQFKLRGEIKRYKSLNKNS